MRMNELLLIASLRKNARETLTSMSKKVGMPVSTIFDKLKCFQGKQIKKHTSLVDFSKLGFGTRAVMILKARKNERDKLREFLEKSHNINTISRINNGYDFIVDVIFKNLKDMEEFGEKIEEKFKIKNKQNFYIIEDIKRETFLSDPEHVKLFEKS